ncbi:cobalamin trafficking protein CblD-like [Diadema antillarum]|uniref:cobalamin trafficking protein CblD-like n=1 Tax=Diadema antillarum TaxID=105358 RepID=UPI003A8BAE4E
MLDQQIQESSIKPAMAKLITRTGYLAYSSSLRSFRSAITQCHRSFSESIKHKQNRGEEEQGVPYTMWPDSKLGPLAPQDPRFPLPGNVGLVTKPQQASPEIPSPSAGPDILTQPLSSDRHALVWAYYVQAVSEAQSDTEIREAFNALRNHPTALECIAQDCPANLRKGFDELFPSSKLEGDSQLTVVTMCQRTQHDMATWSSQVEEEREELLEHFVMSAKEICEILSEAGYWADFIDPSSGQAFLGDANPNTALFETDERFRHLGFDIEDLGCCKCIRHAVWGTHIFVGAIFTNAPTDSSLIKSILKKGSRTQSES